MIDVLNKVLKKIGINYEELSPAEKATYKRWQSVLDGKPITIDSLLKFLKGENERLMVRLIDRKLEPGSPLAEALRAELRVYKLIISVIEAPKGSSDKLEGYLKGYFKL